MYIRNYVSLSSAKITSLKIPKVENVTEKNLGKIILGAKVKGIYRESIKKKSFNVHENKAIDCALSNGEICDIYTSYIVVSLFPRSLAVEKATLKLSGMSCFIKFLDCADQEFRRAHQGWHVSSQCLESHLGRY